MYIDIILEDISIHALCEEGDSIKSIYRAFIAISIHALCEEGDSNIFSANFNIVLFLSTPSARRATL